MQYSGSTATATMLSPPVRRSLLQLDYSLPLCTYRDSIRRVSISGGQGRSALRFFPPSSVDTAAGDGTCGWSSASASSASSPARCSAVSLLSSSSDGDLSFPGWGDAAFELEELRAIALQMVHDGYLKGLIRSFGVAGSSSAQHGGRGPEELLLESWFSNLDVEWVLRTGKGGTVELHLEDGCVTLQDLMERWIKALKTMVQVLCITQQQLRAKGPTVGGVSKAIWHFMLLATRKMVKREQEHEVAQAQFAVFAKVSILRMLDFVDAVAAAALNDDQAPETLPGMLQVYTCIVDDSPAVLALFKQVSSTSSLFDAVNAVFLRRRQKLSDAIWSMMEKVRASLLTDGCWLVSPEFGGVHETTRLMMNYIMLLPRNEGALNLVMQDRLHFRMFTSSSEPNDDSDSSGAVVVNLIKDLISFLEKQLEKTSNSISDPGLRCIFLMNNCSFISRKVSSLLLPSWTSMEEDYKIERPRRDPRGKLPPMEDYVSQPDPNLGAEIETDSKLDGLTNNIQRFIEAYLDVSWEPVMSCLYHDIPRGFLRSGGALDKFESEFLKTYATQKFWKVTNPELRKRLRQAVIERVISGYSKYLAEHPPKGKSGDGPPTITTLELMEDLLEELFEG